MFPVEFQVVDLLVRPTVRLAAGLLRTSLLVRQQRNHAKLCQIAGGWLPHCNLGRSWDFSLEMESFADQFSLWIISFDGATTLHTDDAFTHGPFYTQTLLHTEAFKQIKCI